MDKKGQLRWVIIIVLVAVIIGLLYYPGLIKPWLGKIIDLAKPVTGYATGAADKVIHSIPTG